MSSTESFQHQPTPIELSVVVPAYNESACLPGLLEHLCAVIESFNSSYEVIVVNDGSSDQTVTTVEQLMQTTPTIKLVNLKKHCGKSIALGAGFQLARGDTVITIDADQQDDPEEIPALLKKLASGYDLVSGWKKTRLDSQTRVVASRIFNTLLGCLFGLHLHDYNCGFKVYRGALAKGLVLYRGWHRFIPVFAFQQGARISEIPVVHHCRYAGQSRYGPTRYLKTAFDLVLLIIASLLNKPAWRWLISALMTTSLALLVLTFMVIPSLPTKVLGICLFAVFHFTMLAGIREWVRLGQPIDYSRYIAETAGFEKQDQ